MVEPAHRQDGYRLRCDWGLAGALAVSPGVDVAVVVDVLSFTTTLSVAADRGIAVVPCPWYDNRAAELARRFGPRDGGCGPGSGHRVAPHVSGSAARDT